MRTKTEPWRQLLAQPAEESHMAQLYQDETFLIEAVSLFVRTGLANNEAAILVGTQVHDDAILSQLKSSGINVEQAIASGQLTVLNAREVLDQLLVGGMPNGALVQKVIGPIIDNVSAKFPKVRVWGEMVDLLWKEGELAATIRLEQLWNDLGESRSFTLFCTYCMDSLDKPAYNGILQGICKTHSHLIPHKDYALLDKAVETAVNETIGTAQAPKLWALIEAERDGESPKMPIAQAILMWLRDGMPRVADKVLLRAYKHARAPR